VSNPDRVVVEILVAAPIETVWKALREPAEIARWFGWNYPKLIEDIGWMFVDGVQADEATRTLWAEGRTDSFKLEAVGSQTIVRVIRSAPVTGADWRGIYEDSTEGWITFLQQLRFAMERHPGADRQTLFLNGRAKAAGTPLPAEAAGFGSLAVVPVGERYAVTTTSGDTLEGTVWYRSTYQIGVTVDGFGDGLVVVSARPRTAKSLHGGGQVLITTYGLAGNAFDALRERWTAWWRATYEVIEIVPS
jgi:hypothetical protein